MQARLKKDCRIIYTLREKDDEAFPRELKYIYAREKADRLGGNLVTDISDRLNKSFRVTFVYFLS